MLANSFATLDSAKRVRFARMGSGQTIVFLHGYPENLHIWGRLIDTLSKHFECLAFDWPGMGESDDWPGGTTPMHMADRLATLLDHWHISKAIIVGMDMGGQPALAFAAKYPQRTAGLVVMNSLVLWNEKTSWEITLLRKYGLNRLILRHFPKLVFQRAERTFLPRNEHLPRDLRNDFWNSFKRSEVRNFIVRLCAGYQGTLPKLPEIYAKIVAPTLILWAEKDSHFPPAHGQRLHQLIAGSRLEILPNAEHWMAWHMADTVSEHILRWSILCVGNSFDQPFGAL